MQIGSTHPTPYRCSRSFFVLSSYQNVAKNPPQKGRNLPIIFCFVGDCVGPVPVSTGRHFGNEIATSFILIQNNKNKHIRSLNPLKMSPSALSSRCRNSIRIQFFSRLQLQLIFHFRTNQAANREKVKLFWIE